MVVELRTKAQITIPSSTVKRMGLEVGDQFEVVERKDGSITLMPVVTYPKAYIDKLVREGDEAYAEMKAGERPAFRDANAMTEYLENL